MKRTPKGTAPSLRSLQRENRVLRETNRKYVKYIRDKVNELLQVMGTFPLRPEELDDDTLLDLDPIGIIAGSFEQILEYLRETNEELSIARDELQAIFDATGVGISIIDTDFRIVRCNEKQRTLLVNREVGDITGRYCYEVYCNKESPGLDCPAVDTLATGRSVVVREVEKKGKHFQIVTTPLRDGEGNVTGAIEVLLDITEKKRAEEGEKEQRGFYLAEKLKLATILQSLSDGLFVTDRYGSIISFNTAARKITGYQEAEVLGISGKTFLGMLSPAAARDQMSGDCTNRELPVSTKGGQQRILSITSALVRDSRGEEVGRVFTFRDITEERQRQEVYHRTEKLVALGQLSAGVAHELNTPLGSILGYARLLLRDKELDSLRKERLEIIAEQAKRGSTIIKGLLNFARHSNPVLRDARETGLNTVITGLLKILGTETEKRGISVLTELGDLPSVTIDRRQMEQAVLNIILNAIQAVGNSGMIRIRTFSGADSVHIEVSDNGPGIPEEIKTKIFDPFFTTKPVGQGTGLGLSICAGIVSEHGGSIRVESSVGRGASFLITLPVTTSGGDPDADA